jgi:hypothetical protein
VEVLHGLARVDEWNRIEFSMTVTPIPNCKRQNIKSLEGNNTQEEFKKGTQHHFIN